MIKKPTETIYIYRTKHEELLLFILFLYLLLGIACIIKVKYNFWDKLTITKYLFFLTLASLAFIYSLCNVLYAFLKRKNPLLLLTAHTLTYEDNYIIKINKFTRKELSNSLFFFNPFIKESILWNDIDSITIERYKRAPGGKGSGNLYLFINKRRNSESILIPLKSINLPLYYLRKSFKPYKSIKVYPNSFFMKIKSSYYYTYYHPWRYLLWLTLAICYLIYKPKY